ncbi:hypothetical protein HBB16_02525 [Pseudonocardia sp. MCCB 268]|nr:hypothetical protein [Pseudonocardia cytotoxica]
MIGGTCRSGGSAMDGRDGAALGVGEVGAWRRASRRCSRVRAGSWQQSGDRNRYQRCDAADPKDAADPETSSSDALAPRRGGPGPERWGVPARGRSPTCVPPWTTRCGPRYPELGTAGAPQIVQFRSVARAARMTGYRKTCNLWWQPRCGTVGRSAYHLEDPQRHRARDAAVGLEHRQETRFLHARCARHGPSGPIIVRSRDPRGAVENVSPGQIGLSAHLPKG